jgi:hypothetical protein
LQAVQPQSRVGPTVGGSDTTAVEYCTGSPYEPR